MAVAIGTCIVALGYPAGFFWGASIYLAYSFGSRAILARHHKSGIRRIFRRRWAEALPCFQRSQAFFERFPRLDRYRQVFLMSPSGASYHEMALLNQAICLVYLNRGSEARRLYERVLELYPDSPMAEAALTAMAAGEAAAEQGAAPGSTGE
ncbi:MAG: tetratricopeptide repeat protein [bacterium]|nr:tetratricopeptide repeat protein [bacterium]